MHLWIVSQKLTASKGKEVVAREVSFSSLCEVLHRIGHGIGTFNCVGFAVTESAFDAVVEAT